MGRQEEEEQGFAQVTELVEARCEVLPQQAAEEERVGALSEELNEEVNHSA